jgi:hypothetical protein
LGENGGDKEEWRENRRGRPRETKNPSRVSP